MRLARRARLAARRSPQATTASCSTGLDKRPQESSEESSEAAARPLRVDPPLSEEHLSASPIPANREGGLPVGGHLSPAIGIHPEAQPASQEPASSTANGVQLKDALVVIVNFIPPYNRELIGILAAPEGAAARFRFQRSYVQPPTLDITQVQNMRALICMRNRETGDIIPLRVGTGISGRWRAGVAVFEIHLSSLAIAPEQPNERCSWRQAFSAQFNAELAPFDTSGGQDLKKLVFFSSGQAIQTIRAIDLSQQAQDSRWAHLLDEIDDQIPNLDLDFYRVIQITDSRGKVLTPKAHASGRSRFEVEQGAQYAIEVAQRTYTGKKGDSSVAGSRRIALRCSSDDIEMVDNEITIRGKYSDSELYFSVAKDASVGPRHATLDVLRSDGAPSYGCEIPLTVVRSGRSSLMSGLSVSFFILSFLVFLDPGAALRLLESIGASWSPWPPPSKDSLEKASIFGMLIFSTGSQWTRWISDRLKVG